MDNHEPSMIAQRKTLAYSAFPTYEEYLHQPTALTARLRQRASEVRLSTDAQSFLSTYPEFVHLVALLSEVTPDSWIVPPIWARIVQVCPRFLLRVAVEENDLDLLSQLLDEEDIVGWLEEQELPLLFIFDEELNLQGQWGPHPQQIDSFLDAWLSEHPQYEVLTESDEPADILAYTVLAEQLANEMRVWYNGTLNHACVAELCELFTGMIDEGNDLEGPPTEDVEEEA